MRFHLAYVPDGTVNAADALPVASLGLAPDYLPDIDNINLKDILGLGFPLPTRDQPERYKLYLKLFESPKTLPQSDLCDSFFKAYHMNDMLCGEALLSFTAKKANVAVKFGYIDAADRQYTQSSPFPRFETTEETGFLGTFGKHIPFVSLYLVPEVAGVTSTDDERAADSARGVLAFHKALLTHYREVLECVEGDEPENFYSFRDPVTHTLIRVQKEPFVFKNWRQLPMPTDPAHHFLSGLLLIYRTQEIDTFLARETVFEVGSVVKIETTLPESSH